MSVFLVSCSVFVDIHQLGMLGLAYPFPLHILYLGWGEMADLHGIGGGDRCLLAFGGPLLSNTCHWARTAHVLE